MQNLGQVTNYELQITNPIIVNELDIIEQLTIAAEQAGANLAPTYQEYMPLAFAIATSCGCLLYTSPSPRD